MTVIVYMLVNFTRTTVQKKLLASPIRCVTRSRR